MKVRSWKSSRQREVQMHRTHGKREYGVFKELRNTGYSQQIISGVYNREATDYNNSSKVEVYIPPIERSGFGTVASRGG